MKLKIAKMCSISNGHAKFCTNKSTSDCSWTGTVTDMCSFVRGFLRKKHSCFQDPKHVMIIHWWSWCCNRSVIPDWGNFISLIFEFHGNWRASFQHANDSTLSALFQHDECGGARSFKLTMLFSLRGVLFGSCWSHTICRKSDQSHSWRSVWECVWKPSLPEHQRPIFYWCDRPDSIQVCHYTDPEVC